MHKVPEKLLKVFVYGTLKKGEPNHYWLTRAENGYARFLGSGETVKKFPLVIGTRYNIPFLLDKPNMGRNIKGELYEVDEKMFSSLDILEDYPQYYDREMQAIKMVNQQETLMCWLYLIRNFPPKLLEQTFLESYHNGKERPYKERSERDVNISAKNDMNF